MPYPNFHAARIHNPDDYSKLRYGKDIFGTGIDVIYGITDAGKSEVQAIRFDKTKFTPEEARAWLKKHPEHKVISFEQATGAKTQKVQTDPYDRFQRTLWDLAQDAPEQAHVHYCPTCRLNKIETHDAILQGLDRKVGGLLFGKEHFIPTVDNWNVRPIVFSKIHPDPVKFDEDPEAELTRVQGGITGNLSDAVIENVMGEPRLNVRKNYTDEMAFRFYDEGRISVETLNRSLEAIPKTLQLIKERKLVHSSAFVCPDDGESLVGVVKPHHVLDFEMTPKDQPVDPMAVILNKQETENVTEGNAQLQIGKVISSKNEGKLRAAIKAFTDFCENILTGVEEPAPAAEPKLDAAKSQKITVMKDDDPEQFESHSQKKEKKMGEKTAELITPPEDPKVKELTDQMAKLQKELDDAKALLKTHEDAKVKAQKDKYDADWADLEKTVIPPGEVKDPADKAKLQKMSVEEPLAFAAKVAAWRKAPAHKQEGTTHTQKAGDEDKEAERNRILAADSRKIPGQFH
jgi:hypothetical protein